MVKKSSPGQIALRVLRTVVGLALVPLVALVLVCGLVFWQGQRDEARRVDAIVVLYPPTSAREHLDYSVELHRQGYATRLMLAGQNTADVKASLVNRGLPPATLLQVEQTGGRLERMRSVAEALHSQGLHSALLVDEPHWLLLDLKMARDLGLDAYGSPLPETTPDMQYIVRGALTYWQYVLLGTTD